MSNDSKDSEQLTPEEIKQQKDKWSAPRGYVDKLDLELPDEDKEKE